MHLRVSPPPRHGLRRSWPAFLVLLGLATACHPPDEDAAEVTLGWSVEPTPPATGPATLSLTLTDQRLRQPVRGAEVRLEGGMTHPGMRPVFSAAREVAPGRYRAPMSFTMAGDWFVLVEAKLRDGRAVRRRLDLPGVRAR